jgi:hypothetical protein
MSDNQKPILLLDFDGVVHQKSTEDEYGNLTEGFFEWAVEANKYFALMIYLPIRYTEEDAQTWLQTHTIAWRHQQMERFTPIATAPLELIFTREIPDYFISLNDRSLTFTGRWRDAKYKPETLFQFKSWTDPEYVVPPEDEERPSNVAPSPNTKNICPRHPWMTMQEPNGRRHCTATGCAWQG